MREELHTPFNPRQYMITKDFEIFYYQNQADLSRVEMHSHDYFEFYFYLEGDITFAVGDQTMVLADQEFIMIPPGVLHRADVHPSGKSYRRIVFWVSPDFLTYSITLCPSIRYLHSYLTGEGQKDLLFRTDQITYSAITGIILQMLEAKLDSGFGSSDLLRLNATSLLLYLSTYIHRLKNPSEVRKEEQLYQAVMAYISQHLRDNLSLDALSGIFYVSKYHIAHTFKDNLGISVHQYILKQRLEASRKEIASGGSISNICSLCGFSDYPNFYRAFRKEYGISPSEYRDQLALEVPRQTSP